MSLFRYFNNTLIENTKISSYSIVAVGAIGTVSHLTYGLLWLYINPKEYESVLMRVIGAIVCALLLVNKRWPESWKKFLPWCWFFVVLYTLPFFATYYLLASNYSTLRSMVEMAMTFLVIIVFPQHILAMLNIVLGVSLGVLYAYFKIPEFQLLNHQQILAIHIPAFIFTLTGGLIFSHSNLKGRLAQEKVETLKALAGSIAHEMRNPLGQIQYSLDAIGSALSGKTSDGNVKPLLKGPQLDELDRWLKQGQTAIKRGFQAIDMILSEIKSKAIDTSQFTVLRAAQITQKAVDEFGYSDSRFFIIVEFKFNFVFIQPLYG